jgi:GNAT superfamily N-acetyltransferase
MRRCLERRTNSLALGTIDAAGEINSPTRPTTRENKAPTAARWPLGHWTNDALRKTIVALFKFKNAEATCNGMNLVIRKARKHEFKALGRLLIDVYSRLQGFPGRDEQPGYYKMLANIGNFAAKKDAQVLVAVPTEGGLAGGVVYFGDMAAYGSGGIATTVRNASGIRLLGVGKHYRGQGIGKALTRACIQRARNRGHSQVILHTTQAMQVAWGLYKRLGFQRSPDLDFKQGKLPVFGFRLRMEQAREALRSRTKKRRGRNDKSRPRARKHRRASTEVSPKN